MNRPSRFLATRLSALALAALFATAIPRAHAADCAAMSCFDAGSFVAEVTSVSPSWDRLHRTHYLRLNVRFRNTGTQPISLAFPWRSAATMTDNYGNAYNIDWRYPQRISGIAVISRSGVKGNFTIAPGSSRTASWIFNRNVGSTPVGNAFTADLPVEDLIPIPGQQKVRVGNQYSLDFQQLHGGSLSMLGNGSNSQGNHVEQVAEGVGLLLNALKKH